MSYVLKVGGSGLLMSDEDVRLYKHKNMIACCAKNQSLNFVKSAC